MVALVIVAALWTASLGPSAVLTGGESARGTTTPTAQTCRPVAAGADADGGAPAAAESTLPPCEVGTAAPAEQRTGERAHPVILVLAALILLGVAALLLVALVWAVRSARQVVAAALSPLPEEEVDHAAPGDPLPRVAASALSEAERLLAVGTPRNAVVACWDRLESMAAAAGLSRQPWETSEEFGSRLLMSAGATASAAAELAGLFREARYSTHELTEDHRHRATAALRVIAEDLAAIRRSADAR